jgi:hypothetical protein
MFLVWSGWGLLAPAFGVAGLAVMGLSATRFGLESVLPAIIGGIVASFGCWLVGTRLGGRFMFIPMTAYTFIYAALFGTMAVLPYQLPASPSTEQITPASTPELDASGNSNITEQADNNTAKSEAATANQEEAKEALRSKLSALFGRLTAVTHGPGTFDWMLFGVQF